MAVRDAAQAELIIVASKGAAEFPGEVKEWIKQWLAQKGERDDGTGLLMYLCDPHPQTFGAFALSQFAYLQQAARKGSMDFMSSVRTMSGQTAPFLWTSAPK